MKYCNLVTLQKTLDSIQGAQINAGLRDSHHYAQREAR